MPPLVAAVNHLVCLSALSRVVTTVASTFTNQGDLETCVEREDLARRLAEVALHLRHEASPTSSTSLPDDVRLQGLLALRQDFDNFWALITEHMEPISEFRYSLLLSVQSPGLPVFPRRELDALDALCTTQKLAKQPTVPSINVCDALGVGLQHPFLRACLLTPSAQEASVEVLGDVVEACRQTATLINAAEHVAEHFVDSMVRLAQFWFHFVILVLALWSCMAVRYPDQQAASGTVWRHMSDDWPNECAPSTTQFENATTNHTFGTRSQVWPALSKNVDPGCFFFTETPLTLSLPDRDFSRFYRQHLVDLLWSNTSGDRGLGTPLTMESLQLFGAVILRIANPSIEEDSLQSLLPVGLRKSSCVANITETFRFPSTRLSFPCDAWWHIAIPTSSTAAEAAAMLDTMPPLDTFPNATNAVFLHFTAVSPSTGIIVNARHSLLWPQTGVGTVHFMVNSVVPASVAPSILLLSLPQIAAWIASLLTMLYVRMTAKIWAGVSTFAFNGIMTTLLVAEHVLRAESEGSWVDTSQTLHFPRGLDAATTSSTDASAIHAFWLVAILGSTVRFLRDVDGAQAIVSSVVRASLDLIGMLALFLLWTFGFVVAGIVLFGDSQPLFANPVGTFVALIMLLFNADAASALTFETLTTSHPTSGPLFFFTFRCFVTFFAINMLIAVVTEPLSQARIETLHLETVRQEVRHSAMMQSTEGAWLARLSFSLNTYVVHPLADFFVSTLIFPVRHWSVCAGNLRKLYRIDDATDPAKVLRSATNLLSTVLLHAGDEGWHQAGVAAVIVDTKGGPRSPLGARLSAVNLKTQKPYVFCGDIALAWSLAMVLSEMRSGTLRSARLAKLTRLLANFDHCWSRTVELHESAVEAFDGYSRNVTVRQAGTPASAVARSPAVASECFYFVKYLDQYLVRMKFFLFPCCAILACSFWFFEPIMTGNASVTHKPTSGAILVNGLRAHLRDLPLPTRCDIVGSPVNEATECRTFAQTFLDISSLDEWRAWIHGVAGLQLYGAVNDSDSFVSTTDGTASTGPRPWLPPRPLAYGRKIFVWPSTIQLRQVRAIDAPCNLGSAALPRNSVTHCRSSASDDYSTAEYFGVRPTDVCKTEPESEIASFVGKITTYPCRRHIVDAPTLTHLKHAMKNRFFDQGTRLAEVYATFTSGSVSALFVLGIELSEAGGTAYPFVSAHAFLTPNAVIGSEADITDPDYASRYQFDVAVILAMVFLTLEIAKFLVDFFRRATTRDPKQLRPPFPVHSLCVLACMVWIRFLPLGTSSLTLVNVQVLVAIVLMTLTMTSWVLIPLASLFSKEAEALVQMMARAFSQFAYVVPFFVIAVPAFAFSGMELFGSRTTTYARATNAISSVGRAVFGDIDFRTLDLVRPTAATVYMLAFCGCVLITLYNLILALVTSSTLTPDKLSPRSILGSLGGSAMWRFVGTFLAANYSIPAWVSFDRSSK